TRFTVESSIQTHYLHLLLFNRPPTTSSWRVKGHSRESGCSGSPGCCCHPDTCGKCQEGWEQNGLQCYYFSTDKLTWEQARDECRRDGADLVKIESEDEQVEHTAMVEGEDKFWIGLTDSVTEDTCLTFWSKGEPDDWKGVNNASVNGEDCVRMGEKYGSHLKCWFDKSCMAPQKRICEKSAETGRSTCI
uniref:C-type lectin domain-containing protein n=1 Tax=Sparus aurata TaxID=8175 RepID=A0A671UC06_SPAAU